MRLWSMCLELTLPPHLKSYRLCLIHYNLLFVSWWIYLFKTTNNTVTPPLHKQASAFLVFILWNPANRRPEAMSSQNRMQSGWYFSPCEGISQSPDSGLLPEAEIRGQIWKVLTLSSSLCSQSSSLFTPRSWCTCWGGVPVWVLLQTLPLSSQHWGWGLVSCLQA